MTTTGTPFTESLFFEDFSVGEVIVTGSQRISEAALTAFAALTGDDHPVHMSDDAPATRALFGGRVAHGVLLLGILQGLMVQTRYDFDSGTATLSWDRVQCRVPVRIGDVVRGEFEIKAKRESRSRPDSGIVIEDCRLLNQNGEVVLTMEHAILVRRRGVQREA